MSPFYEIIHGQHVTTINLNYVIRFEPHGPNTDIWMDTGHGGEDCEVYYLADVEYDNFRKDIERIMRQ